MPSVDYIIVGQGLAGTLVAHALLQRKQSITVFDPGREVTASRIAAGIMNPITGRRFAKSWMYDTLIDHALKCYRQLESELGETFLVKRNILRSAKSVGALNDWYARSSDPAFQDYVVSSEGAFRHQGLVDMHEVIETSGSYQLNIPMLVDAYRSYLNDRRILVPEQMDHQALHPGLDGIEYGGLRAKGVIFCEGANLVSNPHFEPTLLKPSVGERLLVTIPDLQLNHLVKEKYYLAPWISDDFWFGADTHWRLADFHSEGQSQQALHAALSRVVTCPYHDIRHAAAIRPTVPDRRPLIGTHQAISRFHLFNGLGTKGASMAPYWANQFVDFLLGKTEIPKEASLSRFCRT